MSNEEIDRRNWFFKSWKWFIGITIVSTCIFFLIVSLDVNAPDFAQAYSDQKLFQDAIDKANTNENVETTFGRISKIDKLAILEGNVKYYKDGDSVEATVRIVGAKSKGKMDISAEKINEVWNYTKINIRIPNTRKIFNVLDQSTYH